MTQCQSQLSDSSLKHIRAKSNGEGLIPFLRSVEHLPACRCHNCGDLGVIYVTFGRESPGAQPFTYYDDKRYQVVETVHYPCPYCQSAHDERLRLMLANCGVPANEWDWDVHHIQGKGGKESAYRAACSILAEAPAPTGLIIFYGGYGMGKSGLLKSLTVAMIKAGVYAWYVNAREVLTEITATFNKKSDTTEKDILERYFAARFLALDEVDVIGDSQWSQNTIRLLLDKRYESRGTQATVLATNSNPDQLWPYLASRCEDGMRVVIGGESLRGNNGNGLRDYTV